MDGRRLPLPAEWQTTRHDPEPTTCRVTGAACWRVKKWPGQSACQSRCARADYLNGLEFEVRE